MSARIDELLRSVRDVDIQIGQVRQTLDDLYGLRRTLVQEILQEARACGFESGYSNGEYRYRLRRSYRAVDPDGVRRIAPDLVTEQVTLKVDNRRLAQLMGTFLGEQLRPYVQETLEPEVGPEDRASVKRVVSERAESSNPFE